MLEEQLEILHGLWERAGRLVVRRPARHRSRTPLFHPKPVAGPGRPTGRAGGRGRGSSSAARGRRAAFRIAARYADEFNLISSDAGRAADEVRAARRGVPGDRAGPGDAGPLGDGRDAHRRDEAELAARKRALLAAFGDDEQGEDGSPRAEPRWILGTPDRGPREGRAVRRRRRRADHAPGLPAARPRHDRPPRPRADRPRLTARGPARNAPTRPPRGGHAAGAWISDLPSVAIVTFCRFCVVAERGRLRSYAAPA